MREYRQYLILRRPQRFRRGWLLETGLGFVTLALGACNESAPAERIDKLRTLGLSVVWPSGESPRTLRPGDSLGVSLVLAAPLGASVDVKNLPDELAAEGALPLTGGNPSYQELGAFRLVTVQGQIQVPTPPQGAQGVPPVLKVRFGWEIQSGDEQEKVLGDAFIVSQPGLEQSWPLARWSVTSPALSGIVEAKKVSSKGGFGSKGSDSWELPLSLDIQNPDIEPLRVSWFVSSGRVQNRRARETVWTGMDAGKQTVIATVRGLKSRQFAYQIADIEVVGP